MPKLKVLIIDDAVVIRRVLTDALTSDPEIEVSTAPNGRIGLAKLQQWRPDAITLDIEMPEMDGIATLREIRKIHSKLPVIMFSTLTERGAAATLDALAAGASDYLTKPANVGSVAIAIARIQGELIPKIKALCGKAAVVPLAPATQSPRPAPIRPLAPPSAAFGSIEVVAIGISTGGPNALQDMMPRLPADLAVPIVIVQHMPPMFTKLLADRLREQCRVDVREAAEGMPLIPGQALIAPGGRHMIVRKAGGKMIIGIIDTPPENSCRPSVDVLFRSVSAEYGPRALGVIMTGMGSDGLLGCEQLCRAGGSVIIQDEPTSVVWGMPGFVARAQLASRQLPLGEIAGEIARRSSRRVAAKAG